MSEALKRKILLVEDEEATQKLMTLVLQWHLPVDVLIASSMREARELIKTTELDVIIMDGTVLDGLTVEFVRELRRCGFTRLIIAFSGQEDVQERLMTAGCDDRVQKPCNDIKGMVEKIRARLAA